MVPNSRDHLVDRQRRSRPQWANRSRLPCMPRIKAIRLVNRISPRRRLPQQNQRIPRRLRRQRPHVQLRPLPHEAVLVDAGKQRRQAEMLPRLLLRKILYQPTAQPGRLDAGRPRVGVAVRRLQSG